MSRHRFFLHTLCKARSPPPPCVLCSPPSEGAAARRHYGKTLFSPFSPLFQRFFFFSEGKFSFGDVSSELSSLILNNVADFFAGKSYVVVQLVRVAPFDVFCCCRFFLFFGHSLERPFGMGLERKLRVWFPWRSRDGMWWDLGLFWGYLQSLIANEDFQHILRVLNTNVDGRQKIMFALTSIKGVGRRFANLVCKKADVDMSKR